MSAEMLRTTLGWMGLLNYLLLLIWYIFFTCCHDWLYQTHNKWMRMALPVERFDAIHYALMAGYKLLFIVFNIVPFIVLYIVL